jgi:hypothetical protein
VRKLTVVAVAPPNLSDNQWWLMSLLGAIFLLTALLQLFSFSDFSNNFAAMGLGTSNLLAGILIFLEFWAAAGFFKVRLSPLFRKVSNWAAGIVAGFWFYASIKTVSEGANGDFLSGLQSSSATANFFGRFLTQQPGWLTVIEATLFLILVIWALSFMQERGRHV